MARHIPVFVGLSFLCLLLCLTPAYAAEDVLAPGLQAGVSSLGLSQELGGSEPTVLSGTQSPPGEEIAGLRTATSRTFEATNGAAETVISTSPINFRDALGRWQPINDNLVPQGGGLKNIADADQATLPRTLGAEEVQLAQDGQSLSFGLSGASATAEVSGNTAVYPEALPHTAVSLAAVPSGIKETLTLDDGSAPSVFRYDIHASAGLSLTLDADGSITGRDGNGSTAFVVPAPTVHDAADTPGRAYYALTPESGGWELTLSIDGAWLASADRAWPVTVDPTLEASASTACTLLRAAPSQSECNTGVVAYTQTQEQANGTYADETLGLVQWNLSTIPSYATIDDATASLDVETTTVRSGGRETSENKVPVSAFLYPTSHVWNNTADWYDAIVPSEGPPISWGPSQLNTTGGIPITALGGCAAEDFHGCKEAGFAYNEYNITEMAQGWVGNQFGGNVGLAASHVINTEVHSKTAYMIINDSASFAPKLTILWHVPTGKQRNFKYDTYKLTDSSSASVNLRTGNFEYENTDLALAAPGLPFTETRLYNSMRTGTPLDLSMGWKFSYGRETTCNLCRDPNSNPTIDDPGGSVYRIKHPHTALNAEGVNGTAAPEGVDAVWTNKAQEHGTEHEGTGKENQLMFDNGLRVRWSEQVEAGAFDRLLDRDGLGWVVTTNNEGCTHNPVLWAKRTEDKNEGKAGFLQASMTANCSNQIVSITDNTGREWKYGYDTSGRLTSYTDPNKQVTTYSYTQFGEGNPATTSLLTEIKTPGGRVLKISYVNPVTSGIWGRVESITQTVSSTQNATTKYTYNAPGTAPCSVNEYGTTVIDPLNRKSTDCFDTYGRPTHYFDYYSTSNGPYGNEREGITYGSNTAGHPIAENPTGLNGPINFQSKNTYEPDNTGRLISSSEPLGDTAGDIYGDSSNPYLPSTAIDAQGQQESMTYNSTGDLLTEKALKTGIAQPEQGIFKWSSKGLLESAQLGPMSHTTAYHYATNGNLSEVNPPLASINPLGPTKYIYNSRNLVETTTDGRGKVTSYKYDEDGRLIKILFADESGVRYKYDSDGFRIKREVCQKCEKTGETIQTSEYAYDGLGDRLTDKLPNIAQTIPVPGSPGQFASIVYTYNVDGTLASLINAGGTTSYAYNHDGLVSTVTDPATSPYSIQYHYDLGEVTNAHPQGLLTSITYPNKEGTTVLTTAYKYNNDGSVSSVESLKTGQGTPLQSWKYDYSSHTLGQGSGPTTALRQWVTSTAGQAIGYRYDYLERLIQVDVYASNTVGAQEVEQYKYCYNSCAGHGSEEEGGSNLLQKIYTPYTNGVPGTPVVENYTYDVANQLLTAATVKVGHTANGDNSGHAKLPGNPLLPGNAVLELSFNAANQVSQLNTPLSVGGEATPQALAYEDSTNTGLSSVGSTKIENSQVGVSATIPSAGATTYFTRGPAGELLDKRVGSETQYYLADDRGTITGTTDTTGTLKQSALISYDPWGNTSSTIPTFGYLGAYQTPGGLDHFGQRFYDPNIARWTQPDPSQAGETNLQEANPYTYSGDDPVNLSDPEGTCAFERDLSAPVWATAGHGQSTGYWELCH
ncbi:MAG TPA: RHS repeat-associated core domain-containing protein, partial [Solirubrobacteraceae bacterium]